MRAECPFPSLLSALRGLEPLARGSNPGANQSNYARLDRISNRKHGFEPWFKYRRAVLCDLPNCKLVFPLSADFDIGRATSMRPFGVGVLGRTVKCDLPNCKR